MNFSRKAATTGRQIITWSLWEEINTQYLHDIASTVRTYNIPNEFKTNVTMAEQGTAHIPDRGADDKCAIIVTVIQS